MSLPFDKDTCEEVITAIRMRMNYIETGSTTLGAVDIEQQRTRSGSLLGTAARPQFKVKALTREQRDTLNKLDDAAKKLKECSDGKSS